MCGFGVIFGASVDLANNPTSVIFAFCSFSFVLYLKINQLLHLLFLFYGTPEEYFNRESTAPAMRFRCCWILVNNENTSLLAPLLAPLTSKREFVDGKLDLSSANTYLLDFLVPD